MQKILDFCMRVNYDWGENERIFEIEGECRDMKDSDWKMYE